MLLTSQTEGSLLDNQVWMSRQMGVDNLWNSSWSGKLVSKGRLIREVPDPWGPPLFRCWGYEKEPVKSEKWSVKYKVNQESMVSWKGSDKNISNRREWLTVYSAAESK